MTVTTDIHSWLRRQTKSELTSIILNNLDRVDLFAGSASVQVREQLVFATLRACREADWEQVVMNGGPPCFFLEGGDKFCLRAKHWDGHGHELGHAYVALEEMIKGVSGRRTQ